MSDFIFSKQNIEPKLITKEVQTVYKENKPKVTEYHGDWGSFGISKNLYNGLNPYENSEYIVAVIGGPVLMFRNNSFLNDKESSEGTIAILQRWLSGEMKWDEDLSGPFVIFIINKRTSEIFFVTDLMSFIPVYVFESSKNVIFSTHVDMLARISGKSNDLDIISEVDFILHGVVTYPYTVYKNIFQVAPASEHKVLNKSIELESSNYWVPREKKNDLSINKTATQLRESLMGYINKIVSETSNISQFISGGEDSRTLSSILGEYNRDAFIFLDGMNREGKIAKKVASIYNANFILSTREKLHYLNILPDCSDLVGGGSQYLHAHTYGFHKELNSYSAVFGGLLADALLKGSHIKKVRRTGKLPFIPEIKNKNYSANHFIKRSIFNEVTMMQLTERRKEHLKYIRSFRTESAEEWFELWPSSMNLNITNLHASRRLFRSYEPFMSSEVVKISAAVPQNWKLNRKLFHKMAKPLLKPSKWLKHSDGWYPYYSWLLKGVLFSLTFINREFLGKIGIIKGNQGSWGEWRVVTSSQEWINSVENYASGAELLSSELVEQNLFKVINSSELNNIQRVNFLQTLYFNVKK